MSISIRCRCGKKFATPYNLAGKHVKCPNCASPIEIPQRASPSGLLVSSKVSTTCVCGKSFTAPKGLSGKVVKCPKCQKPVKVGVAMPKSKPEPANSAFTDLLDEVGAVQAKSSQSCPSCKADMPLDAVLCVVCGYHAEAGKRLRTRRIGRRP